MYVADIVQSQLCIVSEDKFVENCINSFYGATSCEVGSTFLLVTHGSLDRMAISVEAFALGLVSAVAAAVYTMKPKRLIRKWRALPL